jgi:hypothetical protein
VLIDFRGIGRLGKAIHSRSTGKSVDQATRDDAFDLEFQGKNISVFTNND